MAMNIRELEKLLCACRGLVSASDPIDKQLNEAIAYCRQQQRRAAKRKLHFELKAAEQRELLR